MQSFVIGLPGMVVAMLGSVILPSRGVPTGYAMAIEPSLGKPFMLFAGRRGLRLICEPAASIAG